MTRYYRRKEAGRRENLGAGLVAAGLATTVAAVSFYLVKIFLSREPLDPVGEGDSRGEKALQDTSEGIEA